MKPINNYENIKEAGGDIQNLPAGGYICTIKKCSEKDNKSGNGTHLEVLFDVIEGEWAGFFEDDYRAQYRDDKIWHGIINQNIPNENSPKYSTQCGFFKRFTNAIEDSNPGYRWDWNEAGLKDKKVGVIFREYEKQSLLGNRYMTTRAETIVSVDAIRSEKYRIPAPKMLDAASANGGGVPLPANTPVPTYQEDETDLPF